MKFVAAAGVAVLAMGAVMYGYSSSVESNVASPEPKEYSNDTVDRAAGFATYSDELVGYQIQMPYNLTAQQLNRANRRKAQQAVLSTKKSRQVRDPRGQTTTAFRDDEQGILVTIVTEDLKRVKKSRTQQTPLLESWKSAGFANFEVKGDEDAFVTRAVAPATEMESTRGCKDFSKPKRNNRKKATATATETKSPCESYRRLARRVATGDHSHVVTAHFPQSASEDVVKDLEAMANSLRVKGEPTPGGNTPGSQGAAAGGH